MRSYKASRHTAFILAAAAVWSLFFGWLFWIYRSEADYRNHYIQRLASQSLTADYQLGQEVKWHEDKVLFLGWSQPEPEFRWSASKNPAIAFQLNPDDAKARDYILSLDVFYSAGAQRMIVHFNDELLQDMTVVGPLRLQIAVPGRFVKGGVNVVQFSLPDARQAGNGDPRTLGISMVSFTFGQKA